MSSLLDAPQYASLTSPEFETWAEQAVVTTHARQRALDTEWFPDGFASWNCDQDEGVIRFVQRDGTGVKARVQILGSYQPATRSWEWGWNNPHVNEELSRDARVARAYGRTRGFAPLTTGIINATLDESQKLLSAAAVIVNAQGVYWAEAGGVLVAMAYREIGTIPASEARPPRAEQDEDEDDAERHDAEQDESDVAPAESLLGMLGSLVLGPYSRHPVVLKKYTPPMPGGARYVPLTAELEARVAPYLLEDLTEMEEALEKRGFTPARRVTDEVSDDIAKVIAFVEHPGEATIGFILVWATADGSVLRISTFQTNFANGVEMYTSNSPTLARTPPRRTDSVSFPEITNVGALYDIHRARVTERASKVATVPLTRGADPSAYEDRDTRKIQSFWVQRGYYRWTDDDALQVTWRGAMLSAWRGLFPWKQITERSQARKRAAVLRRLGMTS